MANAVCRPGSLEALCAVVREHPLVQPRGGGTKPALSMPRENALEIDITGLAGILEYEPGEFTFTAWAGTPVAAVQRALAEHGQYLPFDPPLAARGATLGGTVAAGLSGPGRFRYGGVRDFILGVRYVDDAGQVIRAGGKVVKNAAGFDIPKLMVGSLGSLGVLAELSFKVFPRLPATVTVRCETAGLPAALDALTRLAAQPVDLDALDLVPRAETPTAGPVTLMVRLAGLPDALPERVARVQAVLGGGAAVTGPEEQALWEAARDFAWVPDGWSLVKVPLTPRRIATLERDLSGLADLGSATCLRHYSAGGQVAWVATSAPIAALDGVLAQAELSGLRIFGPPGPVRLGRRVGEPFARRVKQALDSTGKFVEA
jgi:glycolate oxidase FAD binding subunit